MELRYFCVPTNREKPQFLELHQENTTSSTFISIPELTWTVAPNKHNVGYFYALDCSASR